MRSNERRLAKLESGLTPREWLKLWVARWRVGETLAPIPPFWPKEKAALEKIRLRIVGIDSRLEGAAWVLSQAIDQLWVRDHCLRLMKGWWADRLTWTAATDDGDSPSLEGVSGAWPEGAAIAVWRTPPTWDVEDAPPSTPSSLDSLRLTETDIGAAGNALRADLLAYWLQRRQLELAMAELSSGLGMDVVHSSGQALLEDCRERLLGLHRELACFDTPWELSEPADESVAEMVELLDVGKDD
jgi:hypothetical protein